MIEIRTGWLPEAHEVRTEKCGIATNQLDAFSRWSPH